MKPSRAPCKTLHGSEPEALLLHLCPVLSFCSMSLPQLSWGHRLPRGLTRGQQRSLAEGASRLSVVAPRWMGLVGHFCSGGKPRNGKVTIIFSAQHLKRNPQLLQKGMFGLCPTPLPRFLVCSWGSWSPSPAQGGESRG